LPLLFDVADVVGAPTAAPRPIAPKAAPQALQTLRAQAEGPRLIFPPDGAAVQVEALGPKSRGLVLAAGGEDLTWYVAGTPLTADPVSGRVVWRPTAPGFYKLSVVDGQGRKATSRVRIKAG
jgi:penicillin-binding protein 1C